MPTSERVRRSQINAAIDQVEQARELLKTSLIPIVDIDVSRVTPIAGLIGEIDVVLAGLHELRGAGVAVDQEGA